MRSRDLEDGEAQGGAGELISQLPAILKDRRWFIIVPVVIGIVVAAGLALLLPNVYRSTAVMIVESPQLPAEVTGEGESEVVDRRIARIRQQITSRPDLVALIEKHGLYKSRREQDSLSEIIDDMRKAVSLTPTTADLPGNRADQRTVAVDLSFDYSDPVAAQAVAQDLMEKVLDLDATGNAEQATNTAQFLGDQAHALEAQISELEGQIAGINARNGGVLAKSGVTMLGSNSGSYDVQIAALQRDNATLLSQREAARTSDTRDPVVSQAEAQLAAARAVYSETHPDVIFAKQRLAEARQLAKSNTGKLPLDSIDSQIAFNNSQIAALRSAKARDQAEVSASLSAQSRAPLVEQEIAALQQKLTGLNAQYQSVSTRLLAAKAGARAEDEQMGEKLSVIDPPVVPDEPESPNRLKIAILGIAGGVAAGLFLALLVELILRPLRTPDALAAIIGEPPLGIIPVIPAVGNSPSRKRLWPRRRPKLVMDSE